MPKHPPSLLGLLASVHASKQSPSEDMPSPDDDERPTDPRGLSASQAGQAALDAIDDADPEALADALGAAIDLAETMPPADEPAPSKATRKPALHLHIHTSNDNA